MKSDRRRPSAASGDRQRLSIFVAADIHGSEVCRAKFLSAGRFYGVDTVLLAGDLTGKGLVPIVREPGGGFRVRFMGREHLVAAGDIGEVEGTIQFNGFYPYRCDPDEIDEMRTSPSAVGDAFGSAMREQLERWVSLAEDRLAGTSIRAFVMPGNDDDEFVSEILDQASVLENQDGRVINVDGYRRTHAPVKAILVSAGLSAAALFLLVNTESFLTFLAYTVLLALFFWISMAISGIFLPYRLRAAYESSAAKWEIGGVPVVTLAGSVLLAFVLFEFFAFFKYEGLGILDRGQAVLVVLAVGAAIFALSYLSKKKKGLNLMLVFKEIPPE